MSKEILIIIYSVVLILMLFLSFFFSSSDMAYGSVDIIRFESKQNDSDKKSFKKAKKLVNNYDKTISTILLLNDTVNAGLDSISTLIGVNLALLIIGESNPNIAQISELWGFIASMIALLIKIIFGEIIAKSIGKIYNFKLTKAYSSVLNVLYYATYPITFIVSGFANIITYPITKFSKKPEVIEDDLHEMIDEIEEQGSVDEEKADLLHDAVSYTTTEAYEVMTPRVDIYAIDIDDDIKEVIKDPEMFRYTRIPVYEDTIDNIIGYVNSRSLMQLTFAHKKINLREILIEPLRFPRSIEINEILKIFKREKQHFALIIDEYGGIEGLITMEDILEEIVGDIWDENDEKEVLYQELKDGNYIVDGKLNLEDFCELFDIDFDELDTEYVTIAGYCIELLDDNFAKVNDVIKFKNLKLNVLAVDENNTIEKLLVEKIKEESEDNEKVFFLKVLDKEKDEE